MPLSEIVSQFSFTADNISQSIPIVLAISTEDKERLSDCQSFTLEYEGKAVAILRDPEFYVHRKEERCCRQFGAHSKNHPYMKVRTIQKVSKRCHKTK